MRSIIPTLLLALALAGCTEQPCPPAEPVEPVEFTSSDAKAIRDAMDAQEQAWNAGDIGTFMTAYAGDICFTGRSGLTCGRDKVEANYRTGYPDHESMGVLSFSAEELMSAGADHAWMTGRWSIARARDTLDGGFTLLWQRRGKDWLIVRDHSH